MSTLKHTNPKEVIGSGKVPMHLWPNTASALGAIGLLNGMLKYGRTNWRPAGVKASIYYDAFRRHVDAWFEGEEVDPDDGVDHLAAALACLAIIVDARACGQLTDDRQFPGGYRKLMDEVTPEVERLKKMHSDRAPKHYSVADSEVSMDAEGLGVISVLDVRDTKDISVWKRTHYPIGRDTT